MSLVAIGVADCVVMEELMETLSCVACGRKFQPRPQTPRQRYCSDSDCQRERKRRWQSSKLSNDPDYRDNQARAQKAWTQRNPGYWREYREQHPTYVERNRAGQRKRNGRRQRSSIAKMDMLIAPPLPPTGIYRLIRIENNEIAKMDVWTVEITLLSTHSYAPSMIAKR